MWPDENYVVALFIGGYGERVQELELLARVVGGDKAARKCVIEFVEALPRSDVRGIKAFTLVEQSCENPPLGRYYLAGYVVIFMKWFKDLERLGVRSLLGRTVFHEVGHHHAATVVRILDPRLGEAYALGFEKAKVSQLGLEEALSDESLLQKID